MASSQAYAFEDTPSAVFALDWMMQLDLGHVEDCEVTTATGANFEETDDFMKGWRIGGTVPTASALLVHYELLTWIVVSGAITNWFGLFRCGGRG